MNTIKKLAILLLIPSTIFGASQGKRITNHSSASVLPYCFHDKRVYVLLGEEQRSQGRCWTDFGGKKDPKETALQTAERECYEESANVLGRGIINVVEWLCQGIRKLELEYLFNWQFTKNILQ